MAFASLMLFPIVACSQAAPVEVADVWARDTASGTANAAVFMTITSPAADRLVGASTAFAETTDLMTMKSGDGTMAMAYLDAIDLPAGKPISLDPSGLHVWLEGLEQPLRAGETFTLVLEFERAGKREVTVSVIAPAAMPPMSEMG